MKNLKSVPVLLATLLVSVNAVAELEKPQTTQDQFSYAIGYQIGSQIAQQLMSVGLDGIQLFWRRPLRMSLPETNRH